MALLVKLSDCIVNDVRHNVPLKCKYFKGVGQTQVNIVYLFKYYDWEYDLGTSNVRFLWSDEVIENGCWPSVLINDESF